MATPTPLRSDTLPDQPVELRHPSFISHSTPEPSARVSLLRKYHDNSGSVKTRLDHDGLASQMIHLQASMLSASSPLYHGRNYPPQLNKDSDIRLIINILLRDSVNSTFTIMTGSV